MVWKEKNFQFMETARILEIGYMLKIIVWGILSVLNNGKIGETYCIGGDSEKTNLQVVDTICAALDNHCNENAPHANLKEFRQRPPRT